MASDSSSSTAGEASMSYPVFSDRNFFKRGAKPPKKPKIRQLWHYLAVAHEPTFVLRPTSQVQKSKHNKSMLS
uniref:Uncharacterized protein n=1 Tax=Aegilops tauschii TaxID=37682 RepID=M8ATE2_AEGTA